jgi:hypothetical protein
VELRILGELEVRHEGLDVPISGTQQRKALAVLLLESGRTVSMQRLIEALWQGEPPNSASNPTAACATSTSPSSAKTPAWTWCRGHPPRRRDPNRPAPPMPMRRPWPAGPPHLPPAPNARPPGPPACRPAASPGWSHSVS